MDIIIGLGVFALVVVVILLAAKRSQKKRQADAWTGVVLKKWIASYSDDDGNINKTPMIQVEKEDGKKKKLSVLASTYDQLEVGDKVRKEAGQMDPAKA